jgi:hypothetical protein
MLGSTILGNPYTLIISVKFTVCIYHRTVEHRDSIPQHRAM